MNENAPERWRLLARQKIATQREIETKKNKNTRAPCALSE
jgi:hypothetical protein